MLWSVLSEAGVGESCQYEVAVVKTSESPYLVLVLPICDAVITLAVVSFLEYTKVGPALGLCTCTVCFAWNAFLLIDPPFPYSVKSK